MFTQIFAVLPAFVPFLLIPLFIGSAAAFGLAQYHSFKKGTPETKWEHTRYLLESNLYNDETNIYEYRNSPRRNWKVLSAKEPQLKSVIDNALSNRTNDYVLNSPHFEKRSDGRIVLIHEEALKGKEWALRDADNLVKLIAEYEAKYTVLMRDDKFYNNRFVDERFEKVYDEHFMKSLNDTLKRIATADAKKNIMNDEYLKSSLMSKMYQEHYVMKKSSIMEAKRNLQDKYDALVALQGEHTIPIEHFKEAFGDDSTAVFVNNDIPAQHSNRL